MGNNTNYFHTPPNQENWKNKAESRKGGCDTFW